MAHQEMTAKEGLELCEEILEMAGELENNERAEAFVSSVTDKVTSMAEWIEQNNTITDKQHQSLQNMKSGLERWLHRG